MRVSTGVDCVVRTSLPALLLFADDTACELTTAAADDVTATELVDVAPQEAAAAGVDVAGADVAAAAVDVTLLLLL